MEAIRQHIQAGGDLNAKDPYGSTPLIIAAVFGNTEVALELIGAGVDLDIRNNDGATALHSAAFLCRREIVRALLERGADKYVRDDSGNTPSGTLAGPFESALPIYQDLQQALGPLGLTLDFEEIRRTRPLVAEILRPSAEELAAVEYTPVAGGDWPVSTPLKEGLDPGLVAELYLDASGLTTLFGLLVIKNGRLIAEGYFNEGSVKQLSARQSVTKSYTSALMGIALDQGYLSSVDQRMMEFFPEFAGRLEDPRKEEITLRDLLQMRAGYPNEERRKEYLDTLFFTENWHWLPHLVDFPLLGDPGTRFRYSNLTSHLLAVIVARAVGTDLASFARESLFSPMGAELGGWSTDADGYNFGALEISVTARDMAKFGLMYMNGGEFQEKRILSTDWVRESLQTLPADDDPTRGRYFRELGYGYQWWSATAGEHRFDYAHGHGGSLIVLLHDLDMIIVTTADPLYEFPGESAWPFEGAIIDTVGKFIASLPAGEETAADQREVSWISS
jgi:CubicO group peptidase (beta-lactamase class C family)